VARAARFYRFRASACSRAAANCSLMQASERARCFFLYVRRERAGQSAISSTTTANDNLAFGVVEIATVSRAMRFTRDYESRARQVA